jgi:DNA recombination protein RmuC
VQTHIDAIAKKYIRPDEGTFDFALMYIPAENVYYEVIVKDDEFGGEGKLFNYALARRVIPVSPNSFYAYLQTVLLGLKGLRIEDRARQIMGNLSRLQKEFATFGESFQLIGKQLRAAQNNFDDADQRFGKITSKLEQIAATTPAALPPPA